MDRIRLPKALLARTLVKSFLLQASWNFKGLQSLGVLYAIAPALRYLYPNEELAVAYRRHLEYFNTHPFMASPVLGIILALEEKKRRGEEGYLDVHEFKKMIMAPFAAMGDALFWGGLRPLAAVIALFFAVKGSLWAPLVFLFFFNIPHLWFRIIGMLRGYAFGLGIVGDIQRYRLPDLAIRLKEGTVVLLGALSAYLVFLCLRGEGVSTGWGFAVFPLVASLSCLARKGASPLLIVLTISALFLVFF
jgi:PTS system mannose-specific IID component